MNDYFFADRPDEDVDAFYGPFGLHAEEGAGYYADDARYYPEDEDNYAADAGGYAEDAGYFAEEAGHYAEDAGYYAEHSGDFAEDARYYADDAGYFEESAVHYPGGADVYLDAGLPVEDHLSDYNVLRGATGAIPKDRPYRHGLGLGSSAAEAYGAGQGEGAGREEFAAFEGDGSTGDADPTWMGEAEAWESTEIVDDVAGTYSMVESLAAEDVGEAVEGIREALHEGYESAAPEELQETMYHLLGTLTPAESFNFSKALRQVGRAGQQVLKDPTAAQIAKSVLPAAGAAVGTVYGGPVGTAIGGQIGTAAAGAFTGGRQTAAPVPTPPTAIPTPPPPTAPPSATPTPPSPTAQPFATATPPPPTAQPFATPTPPSPAAPPTFSPSPSSSSSSSPSPPDAGSNAAKQLFMLTQNPDILKTLLALALGAQGRTTIPVGQGTVPVAGVARMLSTLAGQAAEDAEQLSGWYARGHDVADREMWASESSAESMDHLYETLLAAENARLEAAMR